MKLKYWAAPFNEAIDLICKGEHKTLYNDTDYVYDCCEDWCKGDWNDTNKQEIAVIEVRDDDPFDICSIMILELSPWDINNYCHDFERLYFTQDYIRMFDFPKYTSDLIFNQYVDRWFIKEYLSGKNSDMICDMHSSDDWMPYQHYNQWRTHCYELGFHNEQDIIYMDIYCIPGESDFYGEYGMDDICSIEIDGGQCEEIMNKYFGMSIFVEAWQKYADWVVQNKIDPLNILKRYDDKQNDKQNDEYFGNSSKNLHLKDLVKYTKIEMNK